MSTAYMYSYNVLSECNKPFLLLSKHADCVMELNLWETKHGCAIYLYSQGLKSGLSLT